MNIFTFVKDHILSLPSMLGQNTNSTIYVAATDPMMRTLR